MESTSATYAVPVGSPAAAKLLAKVNAERAARKEQENFSSLQVRYPVGPDGDVQLGWMVHNTLDRFSFEVGSSYLSGLIGGSMLGAGTGLYNARRRGFGGFLLFNQVRQTASDKLRARATAAARRLHAPLFALLLTDRCARVMPCVCVCRC